MGLTLYTPSDLIQTITHWKVCLDNATQSFLWMKITQICLIWDQTFAENDV